MTDLGSLTQSPQDLAGLALEPVDLSQPPGDIFEQILPVLGQALTCDRIFLYLRSPQRNVGRVPFCWRSRDGQ